MSYPVIGMLTGLLLAIAATTGGFGGFVLALFLGALGYVIAGQLSGRFDVRDLTKGGRG